MRCQWKDNLAMAYDCANLAMAYDNLVEVANLVTYAPTSRI